MLESYFKKRFAISRLRSGHAGPYVDGFAKHLRDLGYAFDPGQEYVRAAGHLCDWLKARRVSISDLDEDALAGFRKHLAPCTCYGRKRRSHRAPITGSKLFLGYLRSIAVVRSTAPLIPKKPEPPALLTAFSQWMRQHRGIQQATLDNYAFVICDLFRSLGQDPRRYTARTIRRFVFEQIGRRARATAGNVTSPVRLFLRYAIAQKMCPVGLDGAIPTLAWWRQATLPRYLPSSDVELILNSCDPESPTGMRDRAVLLLLARLGLRAGDVSVMRLADIDWQRATIRVSGKSKRQVQLPLPQEVGDAIVKYLKLGRPRIQAQHLFLTARAPFGPFKSHHVVSVLVRRAIRRAGVKSPNQGAHVLRHSAATQMLRQGASLYQIGSVLRHRSIETTAHYAKVHVNLLREVAQPWPEVLSC